MATLGRWITRAHLGAFEQGVREDPFEDFDQFIRVFRLVKVTGTGSSAALPVGEHEVRVLRGYRVAARDRFD